MMKQYVIPPLYYEIPDRPVIFLAGPIHGAPHWQHQTVKMILKRAKDITIANPRRTWLPFLPDDYFDDSLYRFYRQRPWEKYYMNRASQGGCVLFWLPEADQEFLTKNMVYGATTRFELGEWMTRYSMDPSIGLVIGGKSEFPTLHTIKYDKKDLMGDDSVYETLESLIDAAIETAYEKFESYSHKPDVLEEIKGLDMGGQYV